MVNYENGKIYKISSSHTDKIYIGSTAEKTLARRLAKHRNNYKSFLNDNTEYITSFEIVKYPDAKITLLESYPCKNKDELRQREDFYLESYPNIVNKLRSYMSKERRKARSHKYYNENKEKIAERNRVKVTCICGTCVTKCHLLRHKKSKHHQDYIQKNNIEETTKVKLNSDSLQKKKVQCECGCIITHYKKKRHLNTLKHLDWELENA